MHHDHLPLHQPKTRKENNLDEKCVMRKRRRQFYKNEVCSTSIQTTSTNGGRDSHAHHTKKTTPQHMLNVIGKIYPFWQTCLGSRAASWKHSKQVAQWLALFPKDHTKENPIFDEALTHFAQTRFGPPTETLIWMARADISASANRASVLPTERRSPKAKRTLTEPGLPPFGSENFLGQP